MVFEPFTSTPMPGLILSPCRMPSLAELLESHPSLFDLIAQGVEFVGVLGLEEMAESTLLLQEFVKGLGMGICAQLVFSFLNLVQRKISRLNRQFAHLDRLIRRETPA